MKKLVCILLATSLVATLSLSACGAKDEEATATTETESEVVSEENENALTESDNEVEETVDDSEPEEARSTKYSAEDLGFDLDINTFICNGIRRAMAFIDGKLYVFYNKRVSATQNSDYKIAIIDPETKELTEESIELKLPYWFIPINEGHNVNPASIDEDFDVYASVVPDELTAINLLAYESDDDEMSLLFLGESQFDSEGNLYALLSDEYLYKAEGGMGNESNVHLVKWAPEGYVVFKTGIFDSIILGRPAKETYSMLQVISDGTAFVSSHGDVDAFHMYSGDMGLVKDSHVFSVEGEPQLVKGRDDKLYVLNRENERTSLSIYEYDYAKRKDGEAITPPDELKNVQQFYSGGQDFDMVFEENHKLVGYNVGDDSVTTIMDYEESGFKELELLNIAWLDRDRFAAAYHDYENSKYGIAVFTRVDE
ncbi:MAG: hypothetical protein J5537_00815 [Lachnospiraceae bacterium]|nr:hypothetical protein [Lachnospiraceae bacterium]